MLSLHLLECSWTRARLHGATGVSWPGCSAFRNRVTSCPFRLVGLFCSCGEWSGRWTGRRSRGRRDSSFVRQITWQTDWLFRPTPILAACVLYLTCGGPNAAASGRTHVSWAPLACRISSCQGTYVSQGEWCCPCQSLMVSCGGFHPRLADLYAVRRYDRWATGLNVRIFLNI